jgi:hypothetical protein
MANLKTLTAQQINEALSITNVIKYTGVAVILLTVLYNVLTFGFVRS